MAATQQSFPHTFTTTYIKTNMHHIRTSIVSRHLATRGNNKMLPTPPPHISSSEERDFTASLVAPLPNSEQTNLPSSNHTYNIYKVDANLHPSPLCPLCNTHMTHPTHLFNCTHIHTTLSPLDLWTDPAGVVELLVRLRDKLAGGPKAGW